MEGTYVVRLEVSDFLGLGAPVEFEITATLVVEYAEILILQASGIVDSLSKDQIAKRGIEGDFPRSLPNPSGNPERAFPPSNKGIEKSHQAYRWLCLAGKRGRSRKKQGLDYRLRRTAGHL